MIKLLTLITLDKTRKSKWIVYYEKITSVTINSSSGSMLIGIPKTYIILTPIDCDHIGLHILQYMFVYFSHTLESVLINSRNDLITSISLEKSTLFLSK